MMKMGEVLQMYAAKNTLPLPDQDVALTVNGAIVWYQWYFWENVSKTLEYSDGGKDPKDDTYFSYVTDATRSRYQLLLHMEEQQSVLANSFFPSVWALDYSKRFIKVYGNKLWVLIQQETLIPLQEISSILSSTGWFLSYDYLSATWNLNAYIQNNTILAQTWYALYAFTSVYRWEKGPTDCPIGFVSVPGNIEFQRNGFCVAQYEMSYADALVPNSTGWGNDWNSVAYIPGKAIVSQVGLYPIADITQQEAINACKSLGSGYHLITNSEWMTLARNIESQGQNWSQWSVWKWILYNGVSSDLTLGCSASGWISEPRTYAARTVSGVNAGCNIKRKHILSNGEEVWDLSGNLWEHVNKQDLYDSIPYNEWIVSVQWSSNGIAWDNDGIVGVSDMRLNFSALSYGRISGMGNVYYANGTGSNIMTRGGKADIGVYSWVYALSLSDTESSKYRHTGFRCAK